jgi:hypothetical protein
MHTLRKIIAIAFACLIATPVLAEDFDGSKELICATVDARDCVLQSECFIGEAKEVGAPAFFRLDFKKKVVIGKERTSPISSLEQGPTAMLLQGTENGYGWSIGLNKQSGEFSASMTNFEGSFLMFGSCTVL